MTAAIQTYIARPALAAFGALLLLISAAPAFATYPGATAR